MTDSERSRIRQLIKYLRQVAEKPPAMHPILIHGAIEELRDMIVEED